VLQNPLSTETLSPQFQLSNRYSKQGWMAIQVFSALIGLCLLIKGGRLLIPLFPLGALAVGIFLYRRTPVLYVGFTWWIWFLGSLIRRIIDYQSGYFTFGPWILTPMLVASISFATVIQHLPRMRRGGGVPYILCFGSIVYGLLVELIYNSFSQKTPIYIMGWMAPIVFGFHLFVNWQRYPYYRDVLQSSFRWGVLVMGVYGLVQYLAPPAWEVLYLSVSPLSFGRPEPFEIRVFSSLDGPPLFATVLMTGLLLLLSDNNFMRFPISALGYLILLLTTVRSAWLGWLAGFIVFLPTLKLKLQVRILLGLLIGILLVLPLTTMEPFSSAISTRLESFSNTDSDYSLNERQTAYQTFLGQALLEVTGRGIGENSIPAGDVFVGSDSTILTMLFSLGWLGTIPYVIGVLLLFLRTLFGTGKYSDAFASVSRAAAIGTLVQVGVNPILQNSMGMVLWTFLSISAAAQKYYQFQTIVAKNQNSPEQKLSSNSGSNHQ